MTREILFRGYYPDENRWVYGTYFQCGEAFILKQKKGRRFEYWMVDKFTVGQYSGFNDRYGNKLFEGDIVWVRDALDGKIKREGRILYFEILGEWVVGLKKPNHFEKTVYGGNPELRYYNRQCEKAYDGMKERTVCDDYIEEKWGCEE